MIPVLLWCVSSCLFALGGIIITLAFLRHGAGQHIRNKRLAELIWQSRNKNTDWWLDIGKNNDR